MSQLKVNSIIPVAGVPTGGGGGITQVVSVTKTSQFSVSANSTPQDVTGLTVNITPTSATSKILIIVHVNATANSSYAGAGFTLVRVNSGTATDIFKGDASGSTSRFTLPVSGTNSDTGANNGYPDTHCGSFLDSPNTTNQLTYKIQVADYDNTNTVFVNRQTDSGTSSSRTSNTSGITLMEVSA
tara:strand:- start:27 stop:581 length:555 start_codon:yes stop_codon:yes gene_type:complete